MGPSLVGDEVGQLGPEPLAGPGQPERHRVGRAAQDPGDVPDGQVLPDREPDRLALVRAEPVHRRQHLGMALGAGRRAPGCPAARPAGRSAGPAARRPGWRWRPPGGRCRRATAASPARAAARPGDARRPRTPRPPRRPASLPAGSRRTAYAQTARWCRRYSSVNRSGSTRCPSRRCHPVDVRLGPGSVARFRARIRSMTVTFWFDPSCPFTWAPAAAAAGQRREQRRRQRRPGSAPAR